MNVKRVVRSYGDTDWPFRKYVPWRHPDIELGGYVPNIRLISEFTLNVHRFNLYLHCV